MTCTRCARLEKRIHQLEEANLRYVDILFRVGAQKAGVDPRPVDYSEMATYGPEIPPVVMRAIESRSDPNTSIRNDLKARAAEMLSAGVSDTEVATRLMDGEPVEHLL